jgi:4-alpha-glucanotransferase
MTFGPDQKIAGVLVPVFSLRGSRDLGVGDTAALQEFVKWAAAHGLGAVQILPVNEPGADNSPYNLLSAMALDPLTISTTPGQLPDLSTEDFESLLQASPPSQEGLHVDYDRVRVLKMALLEKAFECFQTLPASSARKRQLGKFRKSQTHWLETYAMHRALIEHHLGSEDTSTWPEAHRSPDKAKAWLAGLPAKERKAFEARITFRAYVQWIAQSQWEAVRELAESLGVVLIGDVPVGVSRFSADVWTSPEFFDLGRSCGAPPEKVFKADAFTEAWGQNWGFPLYDWRAMAADNFSWWRKRLQKMLSIFHLLRVDHALGFFRIYSFPWRPEHNEEFTHLTPEEAAKKTGGPLPGFVDFDDDTEEHREHNRRHGEMVLKMFLEETGPHRLIAEDLGEVAPYVRPTLADLQIPGFKIPQWERSWDRLTPGVSYDRLSLSTFATHDHPPIRVVWEELFAATAVPETREAAIHSQWEFMDFCAKNTISLPCPFTKEVHHAFLRGLLLSNSWLAIHMISDLLGNTDRFNTPGSTGSANWTQRLPCPISELDHHFAETLSFFRQAVQETGRLPTPSP